MKQFISVVLAVVVFVTSIQVMGIEAAAEETQEQKDIEECTFVEMLGERYYAGSGDRLVMLPSQRYTGKEIKPDIVIKDGDYTLQEGVDYSVSAMGLADNVNVNTNPWAVLSVTGINDKITGVWISGQGKYKGGVDCTFAILSENQKETADHFIYEDSTKLNNFRGGVSIAGYVGTETEITIPERIDGKPVYEIGNFAFEYNSFISKVKIPDTMVCIGKGAFYSCKKLQEVQFFGSSQLQMLLEGAFFGTTLREITLPKSLQAIQKDLFGGNTFLRAIYADSPMVYDVEGVLYARDAKIEDLYYYPPARQAETFSIQEGTERIFADAFRDVGSIKNIIVPATVRSFFTGPYGSFYGMTNPVNLIFKHDRFPYGFEKDTFYDLPAGSTITVKNESMRSAVEQGISDNCRDNVTILVDKNGTPAAGLSCTEKNITLSKAGKEKHRLQWSQTPADTTEMVRWSSSNEAVATVELYDGVIEAKDYGACTITGTDESGHQVKVSVQVYDPCTIHIFEFKDTPNKKVHTINVKDEWYVEVLAQVDGYAGERPVKFENSNPAVVGLERSQNVKNKIFITAKKEGTATITAVFDDNGKEIRESVTVHVIGEKEDSDNTESSKDPEKPGNQTPSKKKKSQELQYQKSYKKSYGNQPFTIKVKRKKGNGKLTYASSNIKVVSVNRTSGKVTIKGTGRAVVAVTAAETKEYAKKSVKITVDVSPKKQAISSLKVGKGRKLAVKWKKDNRADGYQIQYSTHKKFKKQVVTKNVTNRKTISKTISKLKKGKTYYVRVRSYKTIKVNGKKQKLYGSFSSVKKSKKIK
ncbi:MAG: leucine-rich repeat protein [Lachnospiraceae bacterium]|nr:leucine-rich repeat protein [Lachnospiraceae bacterium]